MTYSFPISMRSGTSPVTANFTGSGVTFGVGDSKSAWLPGPCFGSDLRTRSFQQKARRHEANHC